MPKLEGTCNICTEYSKSCAYDGEGGTGLICEECISSYTDEDKDVLMRDVYAELTNETTQMEEITRIVSTDTSAHILTDME